MKKKLVIFLGTIIILAGAFFYCQDWWEKKQLKIEMGLARSEFPWRDYSQDELNEMYPQIKYANVPTRVTPEETYAKFREALRTNNLQLALEQLSKDSVQYKENKSDLEAAFNENRFTEIYKNYPAKISIENSHESIAQYYFIYKEQDRERTHFLNFIKNKDGDWLFEGL